MGGNQGGRYIQCDHPGCAETFSLNMSWQFDNVLRDEARRAGWQVGSPKRLDYCPTHAHAEKDNRDN